MNLVLYSNDQIEEFAAAHVKDLMDGKYQKRVAPNKYALYYGEAAKKDLEWVESADPHSKLFQIEGLY